MTRFVRSASFIVADSAETGGGLPNSQNVSEPFFGSQDLLVGLGLLESVRRAGRAVHVRGEPAFCEDLAYLGTAGIFAGRVVGEMKVHERWIRIEGFDLFGGDCKYGRMERLADARSEAG